MPIVKKNLPEHHMKTYPFGKELIFQNIPMKKDH